MMAWARLSQSSITVVPRSVPRASLRRWLTQAWVRPTGQFQAIMAASRSSTIRFQLLEDARSQPLVAASAQRGHPIEGSPSELAPMGCPDTGPDGDPVVAEPA